MNDAVKSCDDHFVKKLLHRGVVAHLSLEPSPQFRPYAEAAKRDPAWRYIEVPATHWLMYTNPHDVAAIILDPERWAGEHE